jgi:hypothetical protein
MVGGRFLRSAPGRGLDEVALAGNTVIVSRISPVLEDECRQLEAIGRADGEVRP